MVFDSQYGTARYITTASATSRSQPTTKAPFPRGPPSQGCAWVRDIRRRDDYLALIPDQSALLDDNAEVLKHSPLERDITRDGATVRVFIYRGQEDAGWNLEIEDESGGSTVWDDLFESDQAALDAALRAVDEDGIQSFFVEEHRDRASWRALWDLAMTQQPAITELKRTLATSGRTMSFNRACGTFAAVASTPELRMPNEWFDMVKGDHVFENLADRDPWRASCTTLLEVDALRRVFTFEVVAQANAHVTLGPRSANALEIFGVEAGDRVEICGKGIRILPSYTLRTLPGFLPLVTHSSFRGTTDIPSQTA
jgi:hypothetical protein